MRQTRRVFSLGLSLLIATACSDTATTPKAVALSSPSAPAFDYAGTTVGDLTSTFNITPSGGTYSVASLFNLSFSPGAVCDPDLSTYGEGTWDSSCVPLKRSVKVTATVRQNTGGVAVDFSPSLRFVPGSQVSMYTDMFANTITANRDYYNANPSALRALALYYAPYLGATAVADYLSDASLVTHISLSSGRVWRRIKHFSGYMAGSGEECNPSPNVPDCVAVDDRF
jgi:hypothetical protein